MTGMSVQRFRMKEILAELKRRGCFTVVGGPWVTVQEDYFDGLADVIFIGEAEETWPRFLGEWKQGSHQYRYEQAEKTDMTKVPTPRFDLLKMRHYAVRQPPVLARLPVPVRVLRHHRHLRPPAAAQDAARRSSPSSRRCAPRGCAIVFIVDDNLIGNKKAIKRSSARSSPGRSEHGYPLTFFTEASIDLADDPELMELMVEANIIAVFVGIESPNEASLRETKKFQNVRAGGTHAREGPPDPGRRHGGLVRDDPRASTTTTRRSSTPRSQFIQPRPGSPTR